MFCILYKIKFLNEKNLVLLRILFEKNLKLSIKIPFKTIYFIIFGSMAYNLFFITYLFNSRLVSHKSHLKDGFCFLIKSGI